MSKVFEAILRLERESGKLPPGVLIEAQEVLQNGFVEPEIRAAPEEPGSDPGGFGSAQALRPSPPLALVSERAFELARMPGVAVNLSPEARLLYHMEPDGAAADRFRLLRMRLWPLWEAGKLKTLLVTSAQAQDGKSTVVLNLATALAEHGQRTVLVVEGDLCHPSLAPRLGIPERPGLAECLEEGSDPLPLLRRMDPLGWYLLPAGRAKGNPTEVLQSPVLAGVFETLRTHFDWIIIDTPPVMPLTDTLSLRQYSDAGLLVVRAGCTPADAVEAAIGRVGSRNLLGVVLNGSLELDRMYSDYRQSYGVEKPKKG